MPSLLVIRLHPVEPITGDVFSGYLTDLSIAAHEVSFADPDGNGPAFGTAAYIAPALPVSPAAVAPVPNHDPANRIAQHFNIVDIDPGPGALFDRNFFAVATAVIEIPDPPPGGEFNTADVRLVISRGGNDIVHKQIYFNVPMAPAPIPGDPNSFTTLQPISLHLALPSPGQQLGNNISVPEDGTAPNFQNLRTAVETVLAAEPGSITGIADLTRDECKHIAYEIIWDRMAYPLPVPKGNSVAEQSDRFNHMYTGPQGADSDDERDRRLFEGDLLIYYVKHNNEAERLANFIFSLSAAIWCEQQSTDAGRVGFYFPVLPATPVREAKVILTAAGGAAVDPAFEVPAAYFYALTAILPPQIKREQRLAMAALDAEAQIVTNIEQAIDDLVISEPAGVNRFQAARRLRALGTVSEVGTPECEVALATPLHGLLTNWLAFSGADIKPFWAALTPGDVTGHLDLLLCAVTKAHALLVAAIKLPAFGVNDAGDLAAKTNQDWETLLIPTPALLPEFTKPGTTEERTQAFIRHLRKFFEVANVFDPPDAPELDAVPEFDRAAGNPLDNLLAAYPTFLFSGWDPALLQAALEEIFPGDPAAQQQFADWLECIKGMLALTTGITPDELQFSVIEALWARGFTNKGIINKFSEADFQEALIGSVAYDHAGTIWINAGSIVPNPVPGPAGFKPVNPDGSLTNCIPQAHRSPLGPVAYLHDLLKVSEGSECADPIEAGAAETLATLLASRRGLLGDLLATKANLEVPIPLIDIVNESLEFMVATSIDNGTVYDTARDEVGGHELSSHPNPSVGVRQHDPETLLEALPQHSTPATPTAQQAAYEMLKSDFSAPDLPYNQALDINCTYLKAMKTCRYATMRRFRENITEFVLDPLQETADFQKHLFRYPVRIETAIAYFCMSQEEYEFFTGGGVTVPTQPARGGRRRAAAARGLNDKPLYTFYGFQEDRVQFPGVIRDWTEIVADVPEFLERTGLTYCEFIDLWKSEFVKFHNKNGEFPECEPCCLDELVIVFDEPADVNLALYQLSVFIRLWKKLKNAQCAAYSFEQLRDICEVLHLFNGAVVNPDFIRQLVSFQIFLDDFQLSLTNGTPPAAGDTGADRMHILAFWAPGASQWNWAVQHLLDQIQQYAMATHGCKCRPPEFIKMLRHNLNELALLSGFEPDSVAGNHHWHEQPTKTLRFAEILAKIYASTFSVGELLFLFTTDPHTVGDDPFPLQTANEANDSPFGLPDDEDADSLWTLRKKLLAVEVPEEQLAEWSWSRIEAALTEDFGMDTAAAPDLLSLGQHFFPAALAESGIATSPAQQRYSEALAAGSTSAGMWNTPPGGPFRYDALTQTLFSEIPLTDEAVVAKLARIRQLNATEQQAVRDLYFRPRVDLARFAFIFSNFGEAEEKLIQESDEALRWNWFQQQFAVCYTRCQVIAEHLAAHVARATDQEQVEGPEVAKLLLKSLWGDENRSLTTWDADSGLVPSVTWQPKPNGGAFSALLGLVGTGMLAEYFTSGATKRWQDVRGGTTTFGPEENDWNAPVPTVLPSMALTLPSAPDLSKFITLHNGFAFANPNDAQVGGAEAFKFCWKGLLLIEQEGSYSFMAGMPTPDGEAPDFEKAIHHKWRVMLNRGQKTWVLLSHEWPKEEAPPACSKAITLKKGMYELRIEVERDPLDFNDPEDLHSEKTGFQLKYDGPDSGKIPIAIPFDKLFQQQKNNTLKLGVDTTGAAADFLEIRYTSSVRDIRRTYLRAYKSMLFAHRLELSAQKIADDGQSELGYMLANPQNFAGQSYYRTIAYNTHKADFDFNFLPILDNYYAPQPADDQRVLPTVQRIQALFDWWERLFDYTVMRRESSASPERPAWLLFHESSEAHTDDVSHMLRHIGVSVNHADIVQRFNPDYELNAAAHPGDLNDDRWAVRAWQAEKWLRCLEHNFYADDIRIARPDLWASIDPNAIEPYAIPVPNVSGNANLTRFFRDGCIENEAPLRYENIRQINDGLRLRGRNALVSFLTHANRVALPWGGFATEPKHLSELLLLDVETGICQKASRIEEAVSAVQLFVQRARLGLESGFSISAAFIQAWDSHFATFRVWETCKRRKVYAENWAELEALQEAQQTESFQFLESEIRRATLTMPVPGSLAYWSGERPPRHPGITLLQNREPSTMQLLDTAPEGLGLMGTPDRHARLNWLAPLKITVKDPETPGTVERNIPKQIITASGDLPMWLQAAVRLGTKFHRIAAAGTPPSSVTFDAKCGSNPASACCEECGKTHPALMDEYYFWMEESRYYEEKEQVAEWGAIPGDPQTDWHRPDKLPGLLHWEYKRIVHLRWCRVHNGEFQVPRQSYEGVRIMDAASPQLVFNGRVLDSLYFEVTGGIVPPGYSTPPNPGFRYDLAPDEAITLPQVVTPPLPPLVGGLPVFPFFAWFDPGAPLLPPSMFSPAIAVAGHLRAHCRFEAALKWYEIVYNPLLNDNNWKVCQTRGQEGVVTYDPLGAPIEVAVTYPNEDCCCASDPVSDAENKDRSILLHYLETLLHWGDALMRKNTPEAFQQARLIFDTASNILGAMPVTVLASDTLVVPFKIVNFMPDCAPLNPRLLCLYSSVCDRLSLIHNCLNAKRLKNGRPNLDMPYFGDNRIRDCWKTTDEFCFDEFDWCLPQSPYRFLFLVQKAQETAAEVRGLGAALLSAFEKGDAEYLTQMRATHERQLLNLTLEIRQNQWRESDWQVQALRKTKEIAQTNLSYYQNLIANGLIAKEVAYQVEMGISLGAHAASQISEGIAQAMGGVPDMWIGNVGPFPTMLQQMPIGSKLGGVFAAAARISNSIATAASTLASLHLTEAGWDRRLQEWAHQVDVLIIEIEQIERQILAAERRRDIALRELNNHQQQIENAAEVHDFLRDKFTNHALFLWMQQETAAMHYQMYELALHCARQAQRAFNLERGHLARKFIPGDIWDNLHEGLLSGERLSLAIKQMEKAYYDENVREYELTKHISLRMHSPEQLLQLREKGYCEVELPEWLFDLDYPGQYMRRIKNVTLTIPCVAGPYTGIHCRLTLLSSRTRVSPKLCVVPHDCCKNEPHKKAHGKSDCCNSGCCSCDSCKQEAWKNNGYEAMPDDTRLVNMYAATEAIATSGGQNDSGMFELNFRDERYLPFEYAGAVSRWRIELPHENNFFDMHTLTDVVMHLNYMTREGGELLRKAANECAQHHVPGDGSQLFVAKQDMPDAWYQFQADERAQKELALRLNRQMFPYLPGNRVIWSEGFGIFFETDNACPADGVTVQFKVDAAFGDQVPDECDGDILEIHCVRSAEWSTLYYGVLPLRLGPIPSGNPVAFGRFKFPEGTSPIREVYLLHKYSSAVEKCTESCCC